MFIDWLFSSQYFMTSLIFPKLFTEAKLITLEQEAKPDDALSNWQTSKTEEHLAHYRIENPSKSLLDTFKHCDNIIEQQRASVKRIRLGVRISDVVALTIISSATCLSALISDEFYAKFYIFYPLLQTLIEILLILSVISMYLAIKKIQVFCPNQKFIWIHLVNFSVRQIILWLNHWTAPNFLIPLSVANAQYASVVCFLLWLIFRFARVRKHAEGGDPILGRQVSDIVFLQNQRMLTSTMKHKLQTDQ